MASSTATTTTTTGVLLLLSILIGVCTFPTTARPCKSIFFITSSSSSQFLQKPNFNLLFPNPNINNNNNINYTPHLKFFVTETHRTRSSSLLSSSSSFLRRPVLFDRSIHSSLSDNSNSNSNNNNNDVVFSSSSSLVRTSIRERTMDIMSIFGALLFGVGCGALTAATMYLIWSLFAPRLFDYGSIDSDDEEIDNDDDLEENSNNKNVFVAVPVVMKPVPPTADEVAAMK